MDWRADDSVECVVRLRVYGEVTAEAPLQATVTGHSAEST
jgi:hypothetical protein